MTISRRCSASRTRRPARTRIFALIAIAALAAAPSWAGPAAAAASRALVAAARDAQSMGYLDAAADRLAEALDLAPADPDANYLAALMAAQRGAPPRDLMPLLERSLAGGRFNLFDPESARLLYASQLIRVGDASGALRFLAGLPRDAELVYLESVAYRKAGNQAAARAAVLEALRRFPLDARAILAWLLAADRPTASPADREVVDAAFRALPAMKEYERRLLFALAPYAPSLEQARLMVREYRAMDGRDLRALALALEYGLVAEADAAAQAWSGAFEPDQATIARLAAALSDPDARAAFAAGFSAYDGLIGMDADRDGVREAVAEYRGGSLAAWSWDPDQDGRRDIEARFLESAPVEALVTVGTVSARFTYGPWPYLESAAFSDGTETRVYRFAPGTLPLELVRLSRLPGYSGGAWLASRGPAPYPTETWLAGKAIRVERQSAERVSAHELSEGQEYRSWWRDASGAEGRADFRDGFPRDDRADMDGDGRFETSRFWRLSSEGAPELERLECDLDGDGVYEYRKRLAAPLVETWDLDADGLPDMGYERLGGSLARVSFSAQADGRLDTSIELSGSQALSATRNGESLALVPDSGGLVTWLGRKPFDFGAERPEPGLWARRGVRYAVHELAGRLYAEAIE